MMTERQIQQMRTSFDRIQPVSNDLAFLFYIRLNELDPSVKCLVQSPCSEQAEQLARLLPILVECVERPAHIADIVASLGLSSRTRVRSMHHPAAVKALLWSLEKALGNSFNPELRSAWAAAYESLAATIESGIGPRDATPALGIRFS
jgi:hemoglobin-like flavoprotein